MPANLHLQASRLPSIRPAGPSPGLSHRSDHQMAAETTTTTPPTPASPPPPAPTPRQRLSGFEQMDARVKELTSSQAELLERIQKLKQEVQNWRSNVEAQVKTCQNELQGLNKGLNTEVEQLKTELKEIRSAIQEEKGNLPARSTNSDMSNHISGQAAQTQDKLLKVDNDANTEEQTAIQA